ncbi:MAG: nucleotide-binding protein [Planctomycetota bacterium]
MKLMLMAISVLLALASFSCRQKDQEQEQQQAQQQQNVHAQQGEAVVDIHKAVVQEVIQANSYTYLKVKEAESEFWIAVTKRQIDAGATISFAGGLEMNNFESKELQRTFEKIYFVDRILGGEPSASAQSMSMPHGMKPELEKKEVSIEPAEGGITIGELFANRDSYADKTVLIKGQVTKVNRAIMDRNWVHLQDGTGDSGGYDLTITTGEEVNVGDVVTFEGKITLNKDFGSGYSYEVIMEQAKLQAQ